MNKLCDNSKEKIDLKFKEKCELTYVNKLLKNSWENSVRNPKEKKQQNLIYKKKKST